MKDFNKPLRTSIFDLLDGILEYDGSPVPIHDQKQKKGVDNTNYVIFNGFSSSNDDKFSGWRRLFHFELEINAKTSNTVSSEICDDIAGLILEAMMPTVGGIGFSAPGFNYINLKLESDKYVDFDITLTGSVIRRQLKFSMQIDQE